MCDDIKKYKLYFLQKKYNNILSIINNLEEHLNELSNIYVIDNIIEYSNKMYDIIKNLNTFYNSLINYYFENDMTEIDNLLKSLDNITDTNIILKVIESYAHEIPSDIFKETNQAINDLIKTYGMKQIKLMLDYIYNPNYFNIKIIELINEINEIVIPLSYSIINHNSSNDYFWKIPTKFDTNDILHKKRELWIKLKNFSEKNMYIKIDVIFKIDKFSSKCKTIQLKSPILQKHKTNIIKSLEMNNIDNKFIKSFIRHDYLGNIYCMSENEYIEYISKLYHLYIKLIDTTFVNIMKEFVNMDSIKKMFDIIFILLLGNDDMVDIGGLLIGIIKEKKNSKITIQDNIYDYIYNNMTFYIQLKIKKSNITIKKSVDKLKKLNVDEVDYKKQLAINKNIPNNIKALVNDKIEELKLFNNEYYKQLLYVKTILNFPWNSPNDDIIYDNLNKKKTATTKYLTNIETKLNESCYGHNDAKKLLLQMIGKWISNPSSLGTAFGLVGPPGVGKTLLAKSISSALDIPFAQITLGGQNDGEILHGHGYTYSGSQPGMIIKKMVEMGKSRCILYFDELDKTCTKHGTINEISSILIHLTDPNMNKTFQDRFFQGVEFPLDKVIMIFSYNDSSLIDPILLDRIKEIKVQPYTIEDKINICRNHIIKEISESVSLDNIVIDNNIIEYIVDNYTCEAGVRDIKRKFEDIYLHLNIDKLYNREPFKKNKKIKYTLTKEKITEILKEPDIYNTMINDKPAVGIICGLYASSNGNGGITPIQIFANNMTTLSKYEIKLTGKQGDVMKESIQCSLTAAIEWLKNNNHNLDELMNTNAKNGFHIHTPDGATSKDGPSAGCAFTCAFISRILNRPIMNDVAMTGEIDLTGKVSKIGGLEFKLMGAKKAGVKIVYIPEENKKDLTEIKIKYKTLIDNNFIVNTVSNVSDIINNILS